VWTYPFPLSGSGGWFVNDSGTSTDNSYIYFPISLALKAECNPRLMIVSLDGDIVDDIYLDEIDKSEFLSQNECAAMRGGGPSSFQAYDNEIAGGGFRYNVGCAYCIQMCVDPIRYLESGEYEDLVVAINEEGDVFTDHGSLPDSMCPDDCYGDESPWNYSFYSDKYGISTIVALGVGPVSFMLFTPDMTCVGYVAVAGEQDTGMENCFTINRYRLRWFVLTSWHLENSRRKTRRISRRFNYVPGYG